MDKLKTLVLDTFKAGVLGVLVLGVGGRLLMRLIAIVAGGETGFDWGGTVEVIVFGALIGLGAGVFYVPLLKNRFSSWRMEGTLLGLGVFLALSFLPIEGKYAIEAYPEGQWPAIVFSFALLFWLFGLAVVRVLRNP